MNKMISFKNLIIKGISERELPCEGSLHFEAFFENEFSKKARKYVFANAPSGRWLYIATHPVSVKRGGWIFDSSFIYIGCERHKYDLMLLTDGAEFATFGGVYLLRNGKLKKIAPEERFCGNEYLNSIEWI